MALGADLRRGAGGAAAALTGGALLHALHRQLLFAAEGGLRKAQGYADPDALAPLRAVAALLLAAEAAAEEAAEDVPQITEVEAAEAAALTGAIVGIGAGKAKLVIAGLLLRVGQDLVGLVDLLEFLLGLLVAGVHVRVIFAGQLFIGPFDLVLAGVFVYAQDLVIVSFFCRRFSLLREYPAAGKTAGYHLVPNATGRDRKPCPFPVVKLRCGAQDAYLFWSSSSTTL